MKKNDGGAAFPRNGQYELTDDLQIRCVVEEQNGVSRRQWYAGMAMQGLLASEHENYEYKKDSVGLMALAETSFRVADAMIAYEEGEDVDE